VVTVRTLDRGLILTPERYDPRRRAASGAGPTVRGCADAISQQVSAKTATPNSSYLVLDTGDAREGIILTNKPTVAGSELGSNKKRVQPGDVIVSRLRPYLRQVAYVDEGLAPRGVEIVCSTEFYVLRSRDQDSVAFLVPLLLSCRAQEVLSASQEGGHHPRFNLATLEALGVPDAVLARREQLSASVVKVVEGARLAEVTMRQLVDQLEDGSERVGLH
jgi:hypothetical protein